MAKSWVRKGKRAGLHLIPAAAVFLAGCADVGGGPWIKAGVDRQATSRAYGDCVALARQSANTEAQIDQDISATRRNDWERADVVPQQESMMRGEARDRVANVIDGCMISKGFARADGSPTVGVPGFTAPVSIR